MSLFFCKIMIGLKKVFCGKIVAMVVAIALFLSSTGYGIVYRHKSHLTTYLLTGSNESLRGGALRVPFKFSKITTGKPERDRVGSLDSSYYLKAKEVFGPGVARGIGDFNTLLHGEWEKQRWDIIRDFFESNFGLDLVDEAEWTKDIMVSYTNNCPYECRFCLANASPRNRTFIDPVQLRSFLESIRERIGVSPRIGLTGGEVTLHRKKFLALLDEVGEYVTNISTNAWFASDAKKAKRYLDEIMARLSNDFRNFFLPIDDEHFGSKNVSTLERVANFIAVCRIHFHRTGVSLKGLSLQDSRALLGELSLLLRESMRQEGPAERLTLFDYEQNFLLRQSRFRLNVRYGPILFHGRAFLLIGDEGYTPAFYTERELEQIDIEPFVLYEFPRPMLFISPEGLAVPLESLDLDPKPLRLTEISRENAVLDIQEHIKYDPLIYALYDNKNLARLLKFSREFDELEEIEFTDRLIKTPLFMREEKADPLHSIDRYREHIIYWLFINPERKMYITLRFLQEEAKAAEGDRERIEITKGLYSNTLPVDVKKVAFMLVNEIDVPSVVVPSGIQYLTTRDILGGV